MANETETEQEPIVVENNTTIIAPEVEQQPTEPEFSEDTIRELDAWCAGIEQHIADCQAAILELRAIIEGHSHDGYAASEHEHPGLASEGHEHEQYARNEHEHATTSEKREDTPPKPTHLWFKKIGE